MAKTGAGGGQGTLASIDVGMVIPAIDKRKMVIPLFSDSGLICHCWSEKARKEILDKQMKRAKTAKQAKDPDKDFMDSLYWLTPKPTTLPSVDEMGVARFGFPSVAFKAAAVSAAGDVDGAKMTAMRRRFHVSGEFVEILAPAPIRREDMVRVGMGTADIRFRGMFPEWNCLIQIEYNASAISGEQIVNLFNLAGFGVGVGEWRPGRNGQFGRFHVGTDADLAGQGGASQG